MNNEITEKSKRLKEVSQIILDMTFEIHKQEELGNYPAATSTTLKRNKLVEEYIELKKFLYATVQL